MVREADEKNAGPGLPPARSAWRWLSYCVLVPLIAASTSFFGCISLLVGLWDRSGRQQHAIARMWARTLLWIAFSPVTRVGFDGIPAGVAVYCSNHLSYYDTPVLFAKLPFQFRIMAKQSLWAIPFIGWYLNRSGQVPIDVKSGRSAIAGLLRGVKTLEAGLPLVLFPEGGRAARGELQPFQSGAAFMAIRAQVPLVPIALIGTYELVPIHVYHLTPRPLKIVAGTPISTVGFSTRDADELTARVFAAIAELYRRHAISAP
jgi:1-acyl-sn-glycerol-3-phosphate acyltransferase